MKPSLAIIMAAHLFPSKASADVLRWSVHIKGVTKEVFQALPRELKWNLSIDATIIEDRLNAHFPPVRHDTHPASPDD